MKKLLLFTLLSITSYIHAVTKNDLEKAMRALDIATVKQILANEKFSQREHDRYLNLAEEVIRDREVFCVYPIRDVTTSYEGPSLERFLVELIGWIALAVVRTEIISDLRMHRLSEKHSMPSYEDPFIIKEPRLSRMKILQPIVTTAWVLLSCKFIYDWMQMARKAAERNKLIRKKYDDAVTIKQLMYTATVVDVQNLITDNLKDFCVEGIA